MSPVVFSVFGWFRRASLEIVRSIDAATYVLSVAFCVLGWFVGLRACFFFFFFSAEGVGAQEKVFIFDAATSSCSGMVRAASLVLLREVFGFMSPYPAIAAHNCARSYGRVLFL